MSDLFNLPLQAQVSLCSCLALQLSQAQSAPHLHSPALAQLVTMCYLSYFTMYALQCHLRAGIIFLTGTGHFELLYC